MYKLRILALLVFTFIPVFLLTIYSQVEIMHKKNGFHTVGLNHYIEHLSKPVSRNRHISSIESSYSLLPANSDFGITFIPRINMGQYTSANENFFDKVRLQYQLESYITVNKRLGVVATYSYSSSDFFAKHYGMIEGTYQIGKQWGVIAGAKVMYWDSAIMTYILGLEKYIGNYWLSLKPSLIVQDGKGFWGVNIGSRRYLNDPQNYIHLGLNYGNSPEYSNLNPDFKDLLSFSSWGGYLLVQHKIFKDVSIRPALSFRREEYKDSTWRTIWGGNIGIIYSF